MEDGAFKASDVLPQPVLLEKKRIASLRFQTALFHADAASGGGIFSFPEVHRKEETAFMPAVLPR